MLFAPRQVGLAALTANALTPVPGWRLSVPAMVAGWLTSELAPHLLALTVADAARELTRPRPSRTGLTLAAGSAAGLSAIIGQSARAKGYVDRALDEGLGPDHRD